MSITLREEGRRATRSITPIGGRRARLEHDTSKISHIINLSLIVNAIFFIFIFFIVKISYSYGYFTIFSLKNSFIRNTS